ncbi:MAG: aminotransferase class V-fold PLP-dependent enzyme [Candidatus Dormibacteria bacterium]
MPSSPGPSAADPPLGWPRLASHDLVVPLAKGGSARYVNLDAGASTSPLLAVVAAVQEAVPWYSSVHRGTGFASQVATRMYESAREVIAQFVGARPDDTVVLVRNSTDALNHLAHGLKFAPGEAVLTTAVEHHANLLPWRTAAPVVHVPVPRTPDALLDSLARELDQGQGRIRVVTVAGASNVTGEVLPIAAIGRLAHAQGALFVVDAAQLAPHRTIDMEADEIDYLCLSGHKMYAPYGAGALVGRESFLHDAEPLLSGGGAVRLVSMDEVVWSGMPERLEAGSPNVLGAVALAAAMRTLQGVGMDRVAEHESALLAHADARLSAIPGLTRYTLWEGPGVDRLGVWTFNLGNLPHGLLAAILSAEYGIGVRHGCFCAHPYVLHLLGIGEARAEEMRTRLRAGERPTMPGMVRASFGIGTSIEDIDTLADALLSVAANGAGIEYQCTGEEDYRPVDDRRQFPTFLSLPTLDAAFNAGGCGPG